MPHQKLQRHLCYLEQDPHNVNLLLTVSECYRQLGEFTIAHRYLDEAKSHASHPDHFVYLEARLLHHLQRIDDAIALIEQSHTPLDANTMGLLALLHVENDNETKAQTALNATLALDPHHPNGQLVRVLLKSLHNDASVDEIESLLESHPQESRLWYILGTTQLRLMNCPAAEQAFHQAARIHPQFYDNWICLGWCGLLQNHLDTAENAYHQAIAIDPDRADGFGGLAAVYASRHQVTEATYWLSQAEERDDECFNAKMTRMMLAQTKPCQHKYQ